MGRPVRTVVAALTAVLFALVFLSHGSSSAQAHLPLAVIQEAGEHTGDGSARPELTGQVRARDRHDDAPRLVDRPGPAGTTRPGCAPAWEATGTAVAVAAYGAVAAPYGMRRQRSGALPAVLQVFRC